LATLLGSCSEAGPRPYRGARALSLYHCSNRPNPSSRNTRKQSVAAHAHTGGIVMGRIHRSKELPSDLLGTPSRRSSQNPSSGHSGGAFSTMPYPPKPWHVGQTVHTRGSAYATRCMPCHHLQHTDARDEALGHYSTAYVLLTKPPMFWSEAFRFLQVLQVKKRADERTRTADLLQVRVIGRALQRLARACKSRISRRHSLLWVAGCCTVLRSQWYQRGIKHPSCGTSKGASRLREAPVHLPPAVVEDVRKLHGRI
jgi:hypothetical protein